MTALPDQHIPTWTLGDRMRKAMEDAGHSPGSMAAIYHMSRTSVSNWIHGRVTPDHRTIIMWANITGVPVWWLLGEELTSEYVRPRLTVVAS